MPTKLKYDLVSKVNSIDLKMIYDEYKDSGVVKKSLNIKKLIENLVIIILEFGNEHDISGDIKLNDYTEDDKMKIESFKEACSSTCDIFWDILNYNDNYLDDAKTHPNIEIIQKTPDGKIKIGADLQAALDDVQSAVNIGIDEGLQLQKIITDVKDNTNATMVINTAAHLFNLLTKVSVYFDVIVNPDIETHYGETIADFENFFAACKNVYDRFNLVKHINHTKLFTGKEEEIIDFVIYLCIISIPVIELCVDRLKNTNESSLIISKDELKTKIEQYYGKGGLTFVLVAVDKFVETFTKKYNLGKKVKAVGNWFTKRCCCCE